MERAPLVEQTRRSLHAVAFEHGLDVASADIDAHAYLAGAKGQRAYTGNILGKGKRCATAQEPERLTVASVDSHSCLAGIRVGC